MYLTRFITSPPSSSLSESESEERVKEGGSSSALETSLLKGSEREAPQSIPVITKEIAGQLLKKR